MPSELAVEAAGLEKSYGTLRVLDGVDLAVARGSVFALLGPNGAGKTTMVRILATLTRADAGQARVAGFDVVTGRRQVRRRISLTAQFAAVDDLQTGEENLRMLGRLAGLPGPVARRRGAELLERFDLTEAGRRTVATWSSSATPAA
jgi:ABC-2 type transport system ATP-binding protein